MTHEASDGITHDSGWSTCRCGEDALMDAPNSTKLQDPERVAVSDASQDEAEV
jgi:hypothetical protein